MAKSDVRDENVLPTKRVKALEERLVTRLLPLEIPIGLKCDRRLPVPARVAVRLVGPTVKRTDHDAHARHGRASSGIKNAAVKTRIQGRRRGRRRNRQDRGCGHKPRPASSRSAATAATSTATVDILALGRRERLTRRLWFACRGADGDGLR